MFSTPVTFSGHSSKQELKQKTGSASQPTTQFSDLSEDVLERIFQKTAEHPDTYEQFNALYNLRRAHNQLFKKTIEQSPRLRENTIICWSTAIINMSCRKFTLVQNG